MKPTAYFVNVCRGGVVREVELIEALREGKMRGAGLDVFEQEPVDPDNPALEDGQRYCCAALGWSIDTVCMAGSTARFTAGSSGSTRQLAVSRTESGGCEFVEAS